MSADPSSSPALRASDADRDRVIETLRAAVADGRLDQDEFDERLDAVLAARTVNALAPLTADLIGGAPAHDAVVAAPRAMSPSPQASSAAELLTIKEKHSIVRRDGDWALPHVLELRTSWCKVTLDLTAAVRSGPELVIEMRLVGGNLDLILAPDMALDSNDLAVRYGQLETNRHTDTVPAAAKTLRVRLVGRSKYAKIDARWSS